MNDLIERIEAASGPDRELDMRIENALGLAKFERDPNVGYGDADYNRVDPKPLTASIDAALTLVPDGFEWCLEYQAGHHVSCESECMIAIAKLGDPCFDWEATAATPALALCAAALKAHQQEQEG